MKFFAQLNEKFSDVPQGIQHLHLVFYSLWIIAQHFFGALKRKSFLFYKVIDSSDVVDVLFCELPVAFAILLRLDDIELGFPETDKGGRYCKNFRNFSNGVVKFFDFLFLIRHVIVEDK